MDDIAPPPTPFSRRLSTKEAEELASQTTQAELEKLKYHLSRNPELVEKFLSKYGDDQQTTGDKIRSLSNIQSIGSLGPTQVRRSGKIKVLARVIWVLTLLALLYVAHIGGYGITTDVVRSICILSAGVLTINSMFKSDQVVARWVSFWSLITVIDVFVSVLEAFKLDHYLESISYYKEAQVVVIVFIAFAGVADAISDFLLDHFGIDENTQTEQSPLDDDVQGTRISAVISTIFCIVFTHYFPQYVGLIRGAILVCCATQSILAVLRNADRDICRFLNFWFSFAVFEAAITLVDFALGCYGNSLVSVPVKSPTQTGFFGGIANLISTGAHTQASSTVSANAASIQKSNILKLYIPFFLEAKIAVYAVLGFIRPAWELFDLDTSDSNPSKQSQPITKPCTQSNRPAKRFTVSLQHLFGLGIVLLFALLRYNFPQITQHILTVQWAILLVCGILSLVSLIGGNLDEQGLWLSFWVTYALLECTIFTLQTFFNFKLNIHVPLFAELKIGTLLFLAFAGGSDIVYAAVFPPLSRVLNQIESHTQTNSSFFSTDRIAWTAVLGVAIAVSHLFPLWNATINQIFLFFCALSSLHALGNDSDRVEELQGKWLIFWFLWSKLQALLYCAFLFGMNIPSIPYFNQIYISFLVFLAFLGGSDLLFKFVLPIVDHIFLSSKSNKQSQDAVDETSMSLDLPTRAFWVAILVSFVYLSYRTLHFTALIQSAFLAICGFASLGALSNANHIKGKWLIFWGAITLVEFVFFIFRFLFAITLESRIPLFSEVKLGFTIFLGFVGGAEVVYFSISPFLRSLSSSSSSISASLQQLDQLGNLLVCASISMLTFVLPMWVDFIHAFTLLCAAISGLFRINGRVEDKDGWLTFWFLWNLLEFAIFSASFFGVQFLQLIPYFEQLHVTCLLLLSFGGVSQFLAPLIVPYMETLTDTWNTWEGRK